MTELFDKQLLPIALQHGLSLFDFWNMTLKELLQYLNAVQEREKHKRQEQYLQASLTASFIGCVWGNKPIPPIHQVFPEIFEETVQSEQTQQDKDYMAMMLYKEQMLDFANYHNKRRQAKKDGENK